MIDFSTGFESDFSFGISLTKGFSSLYQTISSLEFKDFSL